MKQKYYNYLSYKEEQYKKAQENVVDENAVYASENKKILSEIDSMYANTRNMVKENKDRREFNKRLKSSLLSECIMHLFNNSFNKIYSEDSKYENLKKSLVNNLVNDYGTENMLRRFKYESEYLAEVAYLVNTTYDAISEKCSKDGDCYTIDPVVKDNFFSNLNFSNIDKITEKIRDRVEDSVEDFIVSNTSDKEKIKEVLQSTNDKINNASSEEAKQESARLGKQIIKKIERKPKSIFNALVYNLAETVMKDENLLNKYKNSEGKLNMDSIMESAKVTYTFLEMLNTAKIVDKNYLLNIIKESIS